MESVDPNAKWRLTGEEYTQFQSLQRRLWMEKFECLLIGWYKDNGSEANKVIGKILDDPDEHLMNMAWDMEKERRDADESTPDIDLIDYVANEYIKEMIINNNKEKNNGRNE